MLPLSLNVSGMIGIIPTPVTSQVGQIRLSVSSDGSLEANSVVWQEGNVVYQVDHFDPLHAVIMTGSISQQTEQ